MSGARKVAVATAALVAVALVASFAVAGGGGRGGIKLTGEAEVPGPGDPDGSGRASFRINVKDERVCFDLRWKNLDPVLFAHIHSGTADVAGPIVVTFFHAGEEGLTTLSDRRTRLEACTETFSPPEGMTVEELLEDIKDNPEAYYVNVHSTEFPSGAIRGQLKD